MMLKDIAAERPDLVDFFPPPSREQLADFEREMSFRIPNSLFEFWLEWGTGCVFETEEFLSPAEDEDTGESALSVSRECRKEGLPIGLVVFHCGLGGFTCMYESGEVAQVEESGYSIVRKFSSFDEWFSKCLMNEYGRRYGLTR